MIEAGKWPVGHRPGYIGFGEWISHRLDSDGYADACHEWTGVDTENPHAGFWKFQSLPHSRRYERGAEIIIAKAAVNF